VDAPVLKRLFSVTEFHQMGDAGVFGEADRVELLDGEIVQMTPVGSRHSGSVIRLNKALGTLVGDAAVVSIQGPLELDADTELYPDVALLRPRADAYSSANARPADVLLVVEVCDTTGDYDRTVKLPRYARAGIPTVWIVDVRAGLIDVYTQPTAGTYRDSRRLGAAEPLTVPGLADARVLPADILP
jgi:Uma2 family endonuclease